MKLHDLISFLVNPELLPGLYKANSLDIDSEAFLIYMKNVLDLESEFRIFALEETDDDQIFMCNGSRYIQLFPVDLAIDLLSDLDLNDHGYSDLQIAQRLLDYRINDA